MSLLFPWATVTAGPLADIVTEPPLSILNKTLNVQLPSVRSHMGFIPSGPLNLYQAQQIHSCIIHVINRYTHSHFAFRTEIKTEGNPCHSPW